MKSVFKLPILLSVILAALSFCLPGRAQPIPPVPTPTPTITINGITVPALIGTPITINGQTLLITTNSAGNYIVSTTGPAGTNSFVVPNNVTDLGHFILNAVQNNNPANIGFYSTNGEWDVKLGAAYSQNSGQAAALLEVERFGIISPNIGLGLGVLEGNQSGQNGTAAAFGMGDYRHPIGDVAFTFGLFGGYDNYTSKIMGGAKIGIEYRQNAHLGEWAGVAYDFEGFGSTKVATGGTISNPSGLILSAGLNYAF